MIANESQSRIEGEIEEIEDDNSDDQRIRMYEQKLNIKGGKSKKYDKIASSMGFDDDLFSFLDNISSKVKQAKKEKGAQTKTKTNLKS